MLQGVVVSQALPAFLKLVLQQNNVFWSCRLCQDSSIAMCETHNFDLYANALLTSTYAAAYGPQLLYLFAHDWQTLQLHQEPNIFIISCLPLCCSAWANQTAQTNQPAQDRLLNTDDDSGKYP